MTVICYKTKRPIIYNRGTKYEKSCNSFLAYYTHKTKEQAQIECNELNNSHPLKLWNDAIIDWQMVDYFYVDEQEMMEG